MPPVKSRGDVLGSPERLADARELMLIAGVIFTSHARTSLWQQKCPKWTSETCGYHRLIFSHFGLFYVTALRESECVLTFDLWLSLNSTRRTLSVSPAIIEDRT
jgi:hypothetical protein